jgi:hypothetical protein
MIGMSAVSFPSWYSSTGPLFVNGVLVLYVTDDVYDHNWDASTVHVSVYDPIAESVIAGSNEDRISLGHSNTYQVYR